MKQKKKGLRIILFLMLVSLLSFGSLAQAGDIAQLDVPFFSQSYGTWADDPITTTKKIRNIGCMMTSFSMVLKYYGVNTDPGVFNSWLKTSNGYNGEILNWDPNVQYYAATQSIIVTPGSLRDRTVDEYGNSDQDDQNIRDELLAGRPVIVKVAYGSDFHWMVVVEEKNSKFYCWDPLDNPNGVVTEPVDVHGGNYLRYITVQGIVPNINYFTFPEHRSQGWTTGYDTEIYSGGSDADGFVVHVTGPNPGIVSPEFTPGTMADQMTIKFNAKVLGNNGYSTQAIMYIKDETGSWNNPISIGAIATDQTSHEYTVDLSGYSLRSNMEIRQFSLELTNWEARGDEYWNLHWLKIYSPARYWDFSNSALSWKIKRDLHFADFYEETFWRMQATGDKSQIISPYFDSVSGDYTNFGIRYSVKGDGSTVTNRIYYDVGNGFDLSCSSESSIVVDNTLQTVIFDIPTCAQGNTKQILIDLFDCTGCSGNQVAINNIGFLVTDTNDGSAFFLAASQDSELPAPLPFEEIVPFPPPTNLVANPLGSSQIEARWNLVQDAVNYQISIYDHSSGNFINTLSDTDGSVTFTGLTAATSYELEAKAIYLDGESNPTSRVITSTLGTSQVSLASAELLTCESVDSLACTNPRSEFPYTPTGAYVYLKLANAYTNPLYFRFDLYDPSNDLAESFDRYGNYSGNPETEWVTYANLTGRILNTGSRSGQWRIEIHYGYDVNSITNAYTTYYFTVADPPPPPADVPWIQTEVVW